MTDIFRIVVNNLSVNDIFSQNEIVCFILQFLLYVSYFYMQFSKNKNQSVCPDLTKVAPCFSESIL